MRALLSHRSSESPGFLSTAGGEDVGVTGIDDGHGGASEELTTCGSKLDLLMAKSVCASSKAPPAAFSLDKSPTDTKCAVAGPQIAVYVLTLLPEKWWTLVLPSML